MCGDTWRSGGPVPAFDCVKYSPRFRLGSKLPFAFFFNFFFFFFSLSKQKTPTNADAGSGLESPPLLKNFRFFCETFFLTRSASILPAVGGGTVREESSPVETEQAVENRREGVRKFPPLRSKHADDGHARSS